MEVANSPVHIAVVSYQEFLFFFNCDTTCRNYYSKNDSVPLLWDRLCLLQQNFIAVAGGKSLLMN